MAGQAVRVVNVSVDKGLRLHGFRQVVQHVQLHVANLVSLVN